MLRIHLSDKLTHALFQERARMDPPYPRFGVMIEVRSRHMFSGRYQCESSIIIEARLLPWNRNGLAPRPKP